MEPKISLPQSEMNEEPPAKLCPFCLKNGGKYTCPRCNSPYCSVDCYKSEKHRDCSEMFYKDCFMEGLKECTADPEDKRKVMEMLARAEDEPTMETGLGEEDDGDDLHARMEDLDLDKDTAKIWSKLTDQEKKEFEFMVEDGRLGNLMEVWTPWWDKPEKNLVTDVTDIAAVGNKPKLIDNIPNIADLLKSKPSSDVKFCVLNLLYAYVFVCRLHNGDHFEMAEDSANDLLDLSDALGQGHICESTEDAITMCINRLQTGRCNIQSSQEFNINVIRDVEKVMCISDKEKPLNNILSALSDVFEILKKGNKKVTRFLKSAKSDSNKEKLSNRKTKLFHAIKKVEFMLSWTQTYGMALGGLVPEINIQYSLLAGELETVNQSRKQLEADWGGKVRPQRRKLIQELPK